MAFIDFISYASSPIIPYFNYFYNSSCSYIYEIKSSCFYSKCIYRKIFCNRNNVSFAFEFSLQFIKSLDKHIEEFEIELFSVFARLQEARFCKCNSIACTTTLFYCRIIEYNKEVRPPGESATAPFVTSLYRFSFFITSNKQDSPLVQQQCVLRLGFLT